VPDSVVPSTVPAEPQGELAVLDAALGEDGTLALEPALELFAAGYAPVPLITAAPQPLVDGGPALRTILGGLDELGEDQLAAVLRVLDQPGLAVDEATVNGSPLLQAAAAQVITALGAFFEALDRSLPDGVAITLVELPYDNGDGTYNFSDPGSFATALPFTETPEVAYEECRIRVNTTAQEAIELTIDGPRVAAGGVTATAELSATAYRFAVPGDVLVVTSGPADRGALRFVDGVELPLAEATQAYCLKPDGCA